MALALSSAVLFVSTLVTREWIELIFRFDPDNGSGSLEWLIVVCLAVIAVIFGFLAHIEWRRPLFPHGVSRTPA
jgi:hypothetical protein